MIEKEEKVIILDFLPNGYPLEYKRMPVAQALGLSHFTLLELIPRKGVRLELKEEVYIGNPGIPDRGIDEIFQGSKSFRGSDQRHWHRKCLHCGEWRRSLAPLSRCDQTAGFYSRLTL